MSKEPDFTIGIEEEYLLVDPETMDLAEAPEGLMEACLADMEGQVSPEFLKCQIEIGTRVCADISEARSELKKLRACVASHAADYGLAPIAASCHPFAAWRDQHHTEKDRYNVLEKDLAGVARRLVICGMHVHVGIPDEDMRIDLVNQFMYFLPHLLALSCSSPFWQGQDTGLASYRLTVFDNLPRTGLPPRFSSWAEYQRSLGVLTELGVIEDGTKIWWDVRPSDRFPTIEARICDVVPRAEHTLTLAALIQSITRLLYRLKLKNQRWRIYDSFLVSENRWRAQRYGTTAGLIDFGRREIVPMADLIDELIDLLAEDAGALNCIAEVEAARDMAAIGTSAERQRAVYKNATASGKTHHESLQAVVASLIEEFSSDL